MTNWRRDVMAACARGDWQQAYGHAASAQLDRDGWKKVAAYIEAEKARALAVLVAAWREGKQQ